MAAAPLAPHAGGRVTVRSAGTAPADSINPAVHEAMSEIDLDLSQEFPKPLTDEAVRACMRCSASSSRPDTARNGPAPSAYPFLD